MSRLDFYHLPKDQAKLTYRDQDLIKTLKTCTKLSGDTTFTSDDFRKYGLDRFLNDKAHGIGGLFARWKVNGIIVDTGEWTRSSLRSNHGRMIRVYRWSNQQ